MTNLVGISGLFQSYQAKDTVISLHSDRYMLGYVDKEMSLVQRSNSEKFKIKNKNSKEFQQN